MAKYNTEPQRWFRFGQRREPSFSPRVAQWTVGVVLLVALSFLLIPHDTLPSRRLMESDIVPRDIKAPNDMLVEDVESTKEIREKASEAVREVFDLDPRLSETIRKRVRTALASVRKGYDEHAAETIRKRDSKQRARKAGPTNAALDKSAPVGTITEFEKTQRFKSLETEFFENLRVRPSSGLVRHLRFKRFDPKISSPVGFLLRASMETGVVSDKKLLEPHAKKGISIQVVGQKGLKEQKEITEFRDVKEAASVIRKLAMESNIATGRAERRALVELAVQLLEPNLTVNKQSTESLREKARKAAKPVFFQIKKGEMIAREGERLNPQQVAKLRTLEEQEEKRGFIGSLFGITILIALALTLVAIYLLRFKSKIMRSPRRVVLIGVILLGTMVLVQGSMQVGLTFSEAIGNVEATSYFYAIPFTMGAMLAAILLDFEVALLATAVTVFLSGLLLPQTFGFPLTALVGGLVASFRVHHYRRRSSILLTALVVGLTNAAIVVALYLMEGRLFTPEGWFTVLMGLAGGVLSGIVVSAVLPVLESVFNIASDIKLLELSDLNHPLMRQLVMSAPGTYHHSVVVSNLSEEAAEMIGANALLVRVAAYYHDIGKIRKREYFIENQLGLENRHDQLTPRMSALILISHVKEGIEMARKHNLPEQLIDFIPQHHGTSLISYFYNKAKELEDPAQQNVNEEDFRYTGPKPQSREAGILMLADVVEAASRSLHDPTPARVQTMVRSNVARVFSEGQLDDCELTLRGLNLISTAFIRILTGRFHHRIVYPEIDQTRQIGLEARLDAGHTDEQAEDSQNRLQVAREPSAETLKASESSVG